MTEAEQIDFYQLFTRNKATLCLGDSNVRKDNIFS